jgi:rare lipoprotein A
MRLSTVARAALATISTIAIASFATAALAQQGPRVVLDSAPSKVGLGDSAVIAGHLEDGTEGESITLQKQRGARWTDVATQPVDANGGVKFNRDNLRRSARYRLTYTDAAGGSYASETARIAVSARVLMTVSKRHVMRGRRVTLRGTLEPRGRARRIVLQHRVRGRWRVLTRKRVSGGKFDYRFRPAHRGLERVRAIFRGDAANAGDLQKGRLKVYERDLATWYGPGFYGNRTACGRRLQRGTLGVAHRTLPCGTNVSLLHRGQTITVSVIDRGPYSSADWDLTARTARRLRFSGKGRIGVTR